MKVTNLQKFLGSIPNSAYLAIAVLIFSSSNSFTRIVTDIGQHNLIDGRNPISLCNVLFIGNICALGLMIPLFYRDWNPNTLKAITRKDWISLTITGIFAGAIAPALTFTALGITNIANIVLIGRIEPILTLVLSVWLLRLRIDGWTIAGSLVSFAGVLVAVLLGGSGKMMTTGGFQIGAGEIFVAIAAVISSISSVNTKFQLESIPLGIFTIYRNLIGTVIFFVLASVLYGLEHFADVLSPLLWRWMIFYAFVIVVMGRLCWLLGLKKSTPTELNLATLLTPILTIFMGYLILGQIPTLGQYWGLGFLIIGAVLSFVGNLHQGKINRQEPKQTAMDIIPPTAMDIIPGFKGV